jgi:outer membrane cobalamin receptor
MRAGRKDGTGDLPDWNTLDVDLAKHLTVRKAGTVLLKITTRNLLDCRYETVSGYPMPGRSFMAGVEYKF